MFRLRLIPREEKFYAQFTAIADELCVGARLLSEMLASDPPDHAKADVIKEVEHKCDFIAHEIFQRLHRTFVTPIDREDIHAITGALDNVMDMIDASAGYIRTYRVERVRYGVREMAQMIGFCTAAIREAMRGLESRTGVAEHVVEVNRLENEADRMHQEAVLRLFDEERDAVAILKWKEILDHLEATTDRCEDVVDLVEGVVLKHA